MHHNKVRETPLPVYVGLNIHARTRKREVIDIMFDLGLSVSCDRVLEISTAMGNRVCEQYHSDAVVCPPNLLQGSFTTAAVDNIDHNTSSTTATSSFHGTGISIFQHPSEHNSGVDRRQHHILASDKTSKKIIELPQSYTNVTSVEFLTKDPPVPKLEGLIKGDSQVYSQALHKEMG